jgi:hypothetical protein
MLYSRRPDMTDVWMVESPNKTRVTFVIRGDEKSEFVYSIHSAETELFKTKTLAQRLTHAEVERMFVEDIARANGINPCSASAVPSLLFR